MGYGTILYFITWLLLFFSIRDKNDCTVSRERFDAFQPSIQYEPLSCYITVGAYVSVWMPLVLHSVIFVSASSFFSIYFWLCPSSSLSMCQSVVLPLSLSLHPFLPFVLTLEYLQVQQRSLSETSLLLASTFTSMLNLEGESVHWTQTDGRHYQELDWPMKLTGGKRRSNTWWEKEMDNAAVQRKSQTTWGKQKGKTGKVKSGELLLCQ